MSADARRKRSYNRASQARRHDRVLAKAHGKRALTAIKEDLK